MLEHGLTPVGGGFCSAGGLFGSHGGAFSCLGAGCGLGRKGLALVGVSFAHLGIFFAIGLGATAQHESKGNCKRDSYYSFHLLFPPRKTVKVKIVLQLRIPISNYSDPPPLEYALVKKIFCSEYQATYRPSRRNSTVDATIPIVQNQEIFLWICHKNSVLGWKAGCFCRKSSCKALCNERNACIFAALNLLLIQII